MKIDWLVALCLPLPILGAAEAFQAIRHLSPRVAPVQIPLTGQAQDAAGNRFTLSGMVTLTTDTPAPTPTPDPLALSYLTANPAVVAPGGTALVTVVLTRAALAPVQIALKSADADATVAPSMSIAAGQSQGTAAVTVAATVTAEKLIAIVATYNGQSRGANLTVRPGVTPTPTPTPTPVPVPTPTPQPLGPLTPAVESVTCDGVTLTVKGTGLGTAKGELWWGCYPCLVTAWSDMEVSGAVSTPLAAGYGWYGVRTAAGGFYGSLMAVDEPWPEPPAPPSSRRH